jgi:hypothetical protein
MKELTQQELEIQTKRRKSFRPFVAGIKPALSELAEFVGVENPRAAIEKPEKFLQVLDFYFKQEDFSQLDLESRGTLHLMLAYFTGQLLLHRHGGIWFLNENPDSDSFLSYVVGYFEDDSISERVLVDPFAAIEEYLQEPLGRSLFNKISEIEYEIRKSNSNN